MTPEDFYYETEHEERMREIEWHRFEEEKLNKPECKIIPFSIAYHDQEVKAIIIEGE